MDQFEDLSMKLDRVITKQAEYENSFIKNNNDTAKKSVLISDPPKEQEHCLKELTNEIRKLKEEFASVRTWMEQQEMRMDDLEQYSRSNCLVLHGNSIDHQISNPEVEKYVTSTINSRLNLPVNITVNDIDICHPLPSKKTTKPVIIKFVRRSVRNMVFAHKKNFKTSSGPKLSLTESLTRRRLMLVEESRKYFEFGNVWTQKGNVHCSFKGRKHTIRYFSDIARIRLH